MSKSTRVLIRAKGRGLCIERGLHDCLQRELFADITLKCDGGNKIRANKGVLAAASPVLCSLLKDWPLTEDPCIIMAGYTHEEVQGLVRYVYTGQLSAPRVQGSSWEKIISDFKVGAPLELDDDLASIHEVSDQEDNTPPRFDSEENGFYHKTNQPGNHYTPPKAVGPKIVAVTSPRPLIVQVQSLNQVQAIGNSHSDDEVQHRVNDIPNEMTVDEQPLGDGKPVKQPVKRKRSRPALNAAKKSVPAASTTDTAASAVPSGSSSNAVRVAVKKLSAAASKKSKPATLSKFARRKYVCPYCSRRFLTRGNVKNHLRIHNKDRPYRCSVCQELFAYQGVYQRHLMKHREENAIDDADLESFINESLVLAGEIGDQGHNPVCVLSEGEDVDEQKPEPKLEPVKKQNGELEEAEMKKIKVEQIEYATGSLGANEKPVYDEFSDDEFFEEVKAVEKTMNVAKKRAAITAKGRRGLAPASKKSNKNESTNRAKYQVIDCDFCPMKYHKWSAFYVHRCKHTGETPVFPCGICQLEFSNIKALKEHKTVEHIESMFKCDECGRTFLSRSALLMHQPIHSTKLNFQCRYCPEKSRTLKDRYVHERVHTADVANFQCSHCDKQFNTLVNLRLHLKTHGKDADSSGHTESP